MLKVNVGLSRKVSRDYNSSGFSVNLEGEVAAPLDDAEMVIERIKEFYDLAEESLHQQIERYEGESAIASRDEERPNHHHDQQANANGGERTRGNGSPRPNGNGHQDGEQPFYAPATNKQIQFLLTLGKRQGLSKPDLEKRIAVIVGRRDVDIYGMSKREAGIVLDHLTSENVKSTRR